MADNLEQKKKRFRGKLKNRSLEYNRYGRYLVKDFDFKTLILRFLGQCGDIILMLLPMWLWLILFLLAASGLIKIELFYASTFVIGILILLFVVIGNTYLSVLFRGQSFGKLALRMKVVDEDNGELDRNTIIIREAVGKEIPLILLYIFFGVLGVLGFLCLNGLVVLIDRKHRSIIDILLKTKVVVLSEKGRKPVEEKVKEQTIEVPKTENKIDLHIVSSFSHDGEYGVEDLFQKAQKAGLQTVSICDHNSVKANLIAKRAAPLYNINYVPGINIDCNYNGKHVRLLGYYINSNDQRFATIEYENLAKEKAVSMRRIQLFEEFTGIMINSDNLVKHSRFQVISPALIARYVLTNVENRNEKILQPYLKGNKRDQPIKHFVQDFFAEGKPAYVPIVHPTLKDMIAAIKAAGGVCVLAHPMYSFHKDIGLIEEVIKENRDGLSGIEVFNPRHTLADEKQLLELAKKYHLDITAGSEYHGENKKTFALGQTTCPVDVEVVIQNFVDKYKTHSA
ncbi:putative metal-dependent phosphoesterase TrpH/uncharacterized RDD family membrane protein YckC [Breznakia sp. PF5-3]|uniref:RDD family protein n=1 Tax=unclassified Breznakia TaxID=2623764 RepID=UPI002406A90A|nr:MULTISPECIES: RDD family protein [unclassified Breznakia]MDF9824553.1 putative metal-dependent phosphoesterase TrpH/uncharacterized RDD family membrane protein YckC [Breznakia sp. PM6-1]MDF9835443.1 putative metal-dependent phosphoesterase TrpH/uncharacterized RDD family membrane protein YckC [Breznakia sp. PF5-3]MDF9838585.1 putative metal-dependent phosphoesterase TrpH/uncharacterized RDD family membrane protein YckC [Breznakia sp. PFB2-8]MDF9860602.1 putative metal-dependent phosphoestera